MSTVGRGQIAVLKYVMWRKIKPHTDLHEVLDGWHEPFRASHRYVIDK